MVEVEVAGGLVGEDQRRLDHQGAGDGHALHLAARQLVGPVRAAMREADRVERSLDARRLARGRRPSSRSGRDTFSSADRVGIRLKNWKTKPIERRRKMVTSSSDMLRDRRAVDQESPAVGASSPPIRCNSVLFPEPDGPDDGDELAGRNVERDARQSFHLGVALTIALRDAADGQHGREDGRTRTRTSDLLRVKQAL